MNSELNHESHLLPNGTEVVFYPDTHVYRVRGEELPSVTKLISLRYGDSYSSVNPLVLKKASEYGKKVHEELQEWTEIRKNCPEAQVISSYPEVIDYFSFVEKLFCIEPLLEEKIVLLYGKDDVPVAAGEFDLLCKKNGKLTLIDFKTTSSLNRKSVIAQLNLYLKGAKQSGYLSEREEVDLGVFHLKKGKSSFVAIPVLDESFCDAFLPVHGFLSSL